MCERNSAMSSTDELAVIEPQFSQALAPRVLLKVHCGFKHRLVPSMSWATSSISLRVVALATPRKALGIGSFVVAMLRDELVWVIVTVRWIGCVVGRGYIEEQDVRVE